MVCHSSQATENDKGTRKTQLGKHAKGNCSSTKCMRSKDYCELSRSIICRRWYKLNQESPTMVPRRKNMFL